MKHILSVIKITSSDIEQKNNMLHVLLGSICLILAGEGFGKFSQQLKQNDNSLNDCKIPPP